MSNWELRSLTTSRSSVALRARRLLIACSVPVFLLASGALCQVTRAGTVNLPVSFSGPAQSTNGSLTLSGVINAKGGGTVLNAKTAKIEPFVFTPPFDHPVEFDGGPVLITTQPRSLGPGDFHYKAPTQLTFTNGELTDADNFAIDVLNGTNLSLVSNELTLTTNSSVSILKSLAIQLSTDMDLLQFVQGPGDLAEFTPTGFGTGNFLIHGFGDSDTKNGVVIVGGVVQVPAAFISGPTSRTLSGTYKITGPLNNAKIEFDGVFSDSFGLFIAESTAIVAAIDDPLNLTISAAITLPLSLQLTLPFHFEASGLVIPEPGSVVLFGIGLAVALPLGYRQMRRKRQVRRR